MSIDLTEIFDDQNQLDQKSRAFLLKAIENHNKGGFDYLEFKQALLRLKDLDMDTATAIKTAFATATTVGLTRDYLLESADYYLSILKNEYDQFNNALEKQMEARVHSREKQKSSLERKLEAIRKKVEELEKEKEVLKEKLEKMDAETLEARKKIEQTSKRFGETLESITTRIRADIDQIKTHLS